MTVRKEFSKNLPSKYEGIGFEEGLPLPYVKYQLGNWIIEFGDGEGNFKVCKCFKNSIENHIKHLKDEYYKFYGKNRWNEDFDKEKLSFSHTNWYYRYINGYDYETNLCHRCNNKTPSKEFCNPMYGGKFKRTFGWYIERRKWENNFDQDTVEEQNKNNERLDYLINYRNKEVEKNKGEFGLIPENIRSEIYQIDKEIEKLKRKLNSLVENIVRGEFGYKPIGEMWVNETIMFKLLKEIFPKSDVIQHYRGSELEGLELDVFIKNKKIGFEYNGLQHYKPVKLFGGKKGLIGVKERDKRKKLICQKLGIKLIIIRYDEVVSKNLIKDKIENIDNEGLN
jgi:hypothetical protein